MMCWVDGRSVEAEAAEEEEEEEVELLEAELAVLMTCWVSFNALIP